MMTVLAGLAEFERELIRAHQRRTRSSQSSRREAGAEIQAHAAPAQGSISQARAREGIPCRHRAQLQRQSQHHIETQAMTATLLYRIDPAKQEMV
jgi:hypothetical protein